MQRISILRTGLALAITMAVLNSLCALLMVLSPDTVFGFVGAWAHGLDIEMIRASTPMTWNGFFRGLVGISITAFVAGFVYASTYNLLLTRTGVRRDEKLSHAAP